MIINRVSTCLSSGMCILIKRKRIDGWKRIDTSMSAANVILFLNCATDTKLPSYTASFLFECVFQKTKINLISYVYVI